MQAQENTQLTDHTDENKCSICGSPMEENHYTEVIWNGEPKYVCSNLACRIKTNPGRYLREEGIPQHYYSTSFETFKGNDPLIEECMNYARKAIGGLLLSGPTGCGKTHLAISCLRVRLEHGIDYEYFQSLPELMLEVKNTFHSDSQWSELDVINKYRYYQLLVLDDLGSEYVSDYTINLLYVLLERRINDGKPTIVTTNLTLPEIEIKYNPRIASRLSLFKIIEIKGMPDYRKIRSSD